MKIHFAFISKSVHKNMFIGSLCWNGSIHLCNLPFTKHIMPLCGCGLHSCQYCNVLNNFMEKGHFRLTFPTIWTIYAGQYMLECLHLKFNAWKLNTCSGPTVWLKAQGEGTSLLLTQFWKGIECLQVAEEKDSAKSVSGHMIVSVKEQS